MNNKLVTVRRRRRAIPSPSVCPERRRTTRVRGIRRRDHITPTLRRLHWLPVRQRVLFKIAVLVYQCLNCQAPSYLADDCQLVSDIRPRRLRSSDSGFCAIRRSRTIRRPVFCCRRPTSVELLANRTKTLTVLPSSNGDSFVWVMGPQRFVKLTSCKLAL